jgi:hypothetical protein
MAALPLRKLSAAVTLVFTLAVIAWCLVKLGDVPPGAVTLLVGLNGITVGGYIGSSSYEAVRTPPSDTRGRRGDANER